MSIHTPHDVNEQGDRPDVPTLPRKPSLDALVAEFRDGAALNSSDRLVYSHELSPNLMLLIITELDPGAPTSPDEQ
ncbi:Uncharacterised protein [Burkholderia pseudomallei]|uniref:hypothetical protein n=1 Tax=Burkholderia pseudomallei TaxID=28450 RepID=UPI0005E685B2|nr:hypothetical protein [Burkholderia pseudomallei]CAK1327509.1 Uncharacterised protein [Burkholderia pseudomallei]CAK1338889.1 Uncharacterised protein [Burkholderia pseudomallei]